jgi:hypothetical protein
MLTVTDVTQLEVIFGVKSYNRKDRQELRKERKEFATLGLVSDF